MGLGLLLTFLPKDMKRKSERAMRSAFCSTAKRNFKLSFDTPLTHAVFTMRCVFEEFTLAGWLIKHYYKLFENASQSGKRMCKWRVVNLHQSRSCPLPRTAFSKSNYIDYQISLVVTNVINSKSQCSTKTTCINRIWQLSLKENEDLFKLLYTQNWIRH